MQRCRKGTVPRQLAARPVAVLVGSVENGGVTPVVVSSGCSAVRERERLGLAERKAAACQSGAVNWRWVLSYIVTNIATAATAIIRVVTQPNTRWVRVAVNRPICLELDATIIMATSTGTTITPLTTALQTSALIGSSGERSMAMPRRMAAAIVESAGLLRGMFQPGRPGEQLAGGISDRARQHRHGKQAGADDADAEQDEGKFTGNRLERLGRLLR